MEDSRGNVMCSQPIWAAGARNLTPLQGTRLGDGAFQPVSILHEGVSISSERHAKARAPPDSSDTAVESSRATLDSSDTGVYSPDTGVDTPDAGLCAPEPGLDSFSQDSIRLSAAASPETGRGQWTHPSPCTRRRLDADGPLNRTQARAGSADSGRASRYQNR